MPEGIYDNFTMIDSVIVNLDKLEVKGVTNITIVLDSIQRLSALKKALEQERAAREKGGIPDAESDHNEIRS